MSLKKVSYTDPEGRLKLVLLPDSESEENAEIGVPVGPPDLSELDLPTELEIKLNNELFNRGILTAQDALRRRSEISAAIQYVLKLDTERIINIYAGADYRNLKKPQIMVQPIQNDTNGRRTYRGRR